MNKELPYSPKYSPVNMRNERISSTADGKSINVVDDDGYLNKIKLFLNNPMPLVEKPARNKMSKSCHCEYLF